MSAKLERFIIGLDYGTDSARGVLIDVATGMQVKDCVHPYRHGVMTRNLPDGAPLGRGWALQNAADYVEAAEDHPARTGARPHDLNRSASASPQVLHFQRQAMACRFPPFIPTSLMPM